MCSFKKGILSNWAEFHAPLLYSNASRPDQYFWIFFWSVQVDTCGALHLLRNKSFLHQPLNKFIRWQINHSKKKNLKRILKWRYWSICYFRHGNCLSVTATCPFWSTGHLDNTYDTDSDLRQGKCLYIPLSVEVCSSWFSFISCLCMQACNQFLHGYFKCAFHVLFQTSQEKQNMCLLRGKRGGALWCVCVSCMFYREH